MSIRTWWLAVPALALAVMACSDEQPTLPPPPPPSFAYFRGWFGGYVHDADGAPVVNAPISLQSLTDECGENNATVFDPIRTNEDGWFRFDFAPPTAGYYDGDCFRLTSTVEGRGSDTVLVFVDEVPPGANPNSAHVILRLH